MSRREEKRIARAKAYRSVAVEVERLLDFGSWVDDEGPDVRAAVTEIRDYLEAKADRLEGSAKP